VNSIVKLAVEAQSGTEVVERRGRVQSGKKLKYAVAMKPPLHGAADGPHSAHPAGLHVRPMDQLCPVQPDRAALPHKDEESRSAEAAVHPGATN
jgi:hypothetical protein